MDEWVRRHLEAAVSPDQYNSLVVPLLASPPEPAVPPGRLVWSRGGQTATVWTVQAMPVWEELETTGRFELRTGKFTPPGFEDAYAWMRRRVVERHGWRLDGTWPIWGWTRITRVNLVPDWEGEIGQVLMRLEVPRAFVASSHFDGWHSVLNNGTLYPPDLPEHDEQAFDAWDEADSAIVAELGGTPGVPVAQWPDSAREYAESTWERIFDVDAWGRSHTMQCVMPFIDASWVTRAVRIDALEATRRTYATDYESARTSTVVRLVESGTQLVSRSEAKQLLLGMDKFREVTVDFAGVDSVGQGFVDEVFRVWPSQHAAVTMTPVNMNSSVEFMVRRGLPAVAPRPQPRDPIHGA